MGFPPRDLLEYLNRTISIFPIKKLREQLPSAHRQTLLQHLASMCFSFAESSFSRSVENIRTSDTIPAPVRLCDPKINKAQCSVRNKSLIGFVAAGGAYVWKMSFFSLLFYAALMF